MAKCKHKESCGHEFCLDDCCPEFEAAVETNADRIQSMSDEALTEKLYNAWRREVEKGNDIAINWCNPECCTSEECDPEKHKACILRWLQQPVERMTNGAADQ